MFAIHRTNTQDCDELPTQGDAIHGTKLIKTMWRGVSDGGKRISLRRRIVMLPPSEGPLSQ
jgi:hypothetical protein